MAITTNYLLKKSWNMHFRRLWNGMFGGVGGQYTTITKHYLLKKSWNCEVLLEKSGQTLKRGFLNGSYVGQLVRTKLYQRSADTRCRLKDFPKAMNDQDRWWYCHGTLCYLHDLMIIISYQKPYNFVQSNGYY